MDSLLIAALVAVAPPAPLAPDPALDRRCFALMAALAQDEDPRLRSVGRVAAGWFLGRIDAVDATFDPASAQPPSEAERAPLLRRCGDAMGAAGRDFRALDEGLSPRAAPQT